jgi:hypothetical protein
VTALAQREVVANTVENAMPCALVNVLASGVSRAPRGASVRAERTPGRRKLA